MQQCFLEHASEHLCQLGQSPPCPLQCEWAQVSEAAQPKLQLFLLNNQGMSHESGAWFLLFLVVICCEMHEVDCDGYCLFELCKLLVPLLKGLPQGSAPPLGDLGVSATNVRQ